MTLKIGTIPGIKTLALELETSSGLKLNIKLDDTELTFFSLGLKRSIKLSEIIKCGWVAPKGKSLFNNREEERILPPGFRGLIRRQSAAIQVIIVSKKSAKRKLQMFSLMQDDQTEAFLNALKNILTDSQFLGEVPDQQVVLSAGNYKCDYFTLIPTILAIFALAAVILFGWWVVLFLIQNPAEIGELFISLFQQ
jgi:hypothetical protein